MSNKKIDVNNKKEDIPCIPSPFSLHDAAIFKKKRCETMDDYYSDIIEETYSDEEIETNLTTEDGCENEPQTFHCSYCLLKFKLREEMLAHIEDEHFMFTCDKCNKEFPTDKILRKHLRNAHLPKKFACPRCEKVFTRKDHCRDHMYSHSDKPQFHCKYEHCHKAFRQAINLKHHERTHTGASRKKCPTCNESVVQLTKHMRTHFKTKQHSCNECNKSFTRQSYLTEHKKIHLGEGGFICDECTTKYKSSNALYKHIRSKHTTQRYVCEITGCVQEFNRKDNMMSHMRRLHTSKLINEKDTTVNCELN